MAMPGGQDLRLYPTADGSFTLRTDALDAFYHSIHGAVAESAHVFIQAGLNEVAGRMQARGEHRAIDLLEIGLGTGLNLLLTWIQCLEGKCRVNYTGLEPFPLPPEILETLAYWDELAWPGLREGSLEMMASSGKVCTMEGGLQFTMHPDEVQQFEREQAFDLVYFDAFAPSAQPHLWSVDVFKRMFHCLRPNGVLVTYCAKGQVRRNMMEAGLQVERLPGPPGKRQMLRACRPI